MKGFGILGWIVAAALLGALLSNCERTEHTFAGTARVIDGDSLRVGDTEVRLFGIDAFEGRQSCTRDGSPWPCGEAAASELRKLTAGRTIECRQQDTDTYGRAVSVCSNGTTAPWDARRGRDTEPAQQPRRSDTDASSCRDTGIKGNINRSGERIYHVPGSQDYERTRIDETAGERWFCTEEEAIREGWRPRG